MLQAAEASKLMKEVENGGNSWSNIQTKKISEDKKIPKGKYRYKVLSFFFSSFGT